MSDDRAKDCGEDFAVVVEALLDVGSIAIRVQRAGALPAEGAIKEELQRLIRGIERYLDATKITTENRDTAHSAPTKHAVDKSDRVCARVFGALSEYLQRGLVEEAPGQRINVPKSMPRASDKVLRERFWELRRAEVGCLRAYRLLGEQAGRSWTRIRDIVNGRDERRCRRAKKPAS